jgi:phosphohistidine phosphatase
MKKLYLIRDAKAEPFSRGLSDFERSLRKKGIKELKSIASYLMLRGITVDVILSSCALRAQQTTLLLSEAISFEGQKHFLEELYYPPYDEILSIIMAQDSSVTSLFVVGHDPYLSELVNNLSVESVAKIPPAGVVALEFDIDEWSELKRNKGSIEFFIFPKQFKYYMPKQIRAKLG